MSTRTHTHTHTAFSRCFQHFPVCTLYRQKYSEAWPFASTGTVITFYSYTSLYTSRTLRHASKIMTDLSHLGQLLFEVLPSGRRLQSIRTKISCQKTSFFLRYSWPHQEGPGPPPWHSLLSRPHAPSLKIWLMCYVNTHYSWSITLSCTLHSCFAHSCIDCTAPPFHIL